jgi:DNA-binding NtrC family response regulator
MRKRIVVVDDDQSILDLIQHFLKGHNDEYEVITTKESSDVLRLIGKAKTDLLITDIRMPDINGIALIHEVVRNYPSLKILAISGGKYAVSPESYLNIAKQSGSSAQLEKPFSKEALISAINRLISPTD